MAQILVLLLAAQLTTVLQVVDPWSLPVPGALVRIGVFAGSTDAQGLVEIPGDLPEPISIEIEVAGFETYRQMLPRWTGTHTLHLSVAGISSQITVTASRRERLAGETAASITVIDSETIRTSPSRAVDDMLRQIPGFSLVRRTSSVAAHPGSQGVSMRGVGSNGASRTLVLADGVPLNDPFGSWVYWNRIPKYAIDSIEVVRGGASELYGSSALGGVIHLRTRRPEPHTLAGEFHYGEHGQLQGSIYASDVFRNWGYALASESSRTDGYIGVAESERGLVDGPLASSYRTSLVQLDRRFLETNRFFSSVLISTEDRKNGTPLRQNHTNFRQVSLGTEVVHRFGKTVYQMHAGSQSFTSSFSTVLLNRSMEIPDLDQRVPLGYGGFEGSTVLAFKRHTVVAGGGMQYARGISHDTVHYVTVVLPGRNGGTQRTASAFLEDVVNLNPKADLTWSARWDHWVNEELSTAKTRTYSRWSPKLALTFRLPRNLILRGAAYAAFRAPNLNELYRPFQVGNVTTLANPLLGAERLRGLDGGLEARGLQGRIHVRAGGYWSEIRGSIANVTIAVAEQIDVRQRQNLGVVRARGVEVEVGARPFRAWSLASSYILSDSRVLRFPAARVWVLPDGPPVDLGASFDLQGLRIAQVPRHQFSFSARGKFDRYRLHLQGRSSDSQFEDDRNMLRLAGFFVLDVFLARSLGHGAELFAAGENLTDTAIEVARTPVRTFGTPRTLRFGISIQLGERNLEP